MMSPKLYAVLHELPIWIDKHCVSTTRISEQSFEEQHRRYAEIEKRYKIHSTGGNTSQRNVDKLKLSRSRLHRALQSQSSSQ